MSNIKTKKLQGKGNHNHTNQQKLSNTCVDCVVMLMNHGHTAVRFMFRKQTSEDEVDSFFYIHIRSHHCASLVLKSDHPVPEMRSYKAFMNCQIIQNWIKGKKLSVTRDNNYKPYEKNSLSDKDYRLAIDKRDEFIYQHALEESNRRFDNAVKKYDSMDDIEGDVPIDVGRNIMEKQDKEQPLTVRAVDTDSLSDRKADRYLQGV